MIFDLVRDFAAVLDAMPARHSRRCILKLLDEAIRRDVHFIDRHPTTLFQCLWNTCWWYDGADAGDPAVTPNGEGDLDEARQGRLTALLEHWRRLKDGRSPGFVWFRSLRPPQHRLGGALKAVLKGHAHTITSLALQAGGRLLVSGSADGTVRLWDLHDGSLQQTLQNATMFQPGESVPAVALSHNADWIAASGTTHYFRTGPVGLTKGKTVSDRSLRLWNAHTGALQWSFRGDQIPVAVDVSHDRRRCAVLALDGMLRLYALNPMGPFDSAVCLDSEECQAICQSGPDATGELSVTVDQSEQLHTFKPAHDQPIVAKQVHEPGIHRCQLWWSRISEHVYVYADAGSSIYSSTDASSFHGITCHAAFSGVEISRFTLADDEQVLAFAKAAECFVTYAPSVIRIRDGKNGKVIADQPLASSSLAPDAPPLAACSADASHVVIGISRSSESRLSVFRVRADKLDLELEIPLVSGLRSLSLMEDGTRVVILLKDSVEGLVVIDTQTGELLFELSQPSDEHHWIEGVWLSALGKSLVTRETANQDERVIEVIRRYEIESGRLNAQYLIDCDDREKGPLSIHNIEDQGPIVVSQTYGETLDGLHQHLRVFDAATGVEYAYIRGHGYFIGQPAFANFDQSIVAACSDATVRSWDRETGREGRRIRINRNLWPDGLPYRDSPICVGENAVVASAQDGRYLAWDLTTGKKMSRWKDVGGLQAPMMSAGTFVACCIQSESQADLVVSVRDTRNGQRVASVRYPTVTPPTSLAVSPDGNLLVTGGGAVDPAVRVWGLPEGQLLAEWDFHTFEIFSVIAQSQPGLIVSGGFDGTICVWDLNNGRNAAQHTEQLQRYDPKGHSPISMDTGAYGGDVKLAVTENALLVCAGLSSPAILKHGTSGSPMAWLNAPLFQMIMIDGELHGKIPFERYEHVYFLEGCDGPAGDLSLPDVELPG